MLLASANDVHSYMHCWRHKTPIILRATTQWFAGMDEAPGYDGVKPQSRCARPRCAASKRRSSIPAWGKARLHGMIANRPDWTLSRQRQWGVPMPFFIRKETGELHPRTLELLEQVAKRVEQGGIEAWQALDAGGAARRRRARTTRRSKTRSTCGSIPARRITRCCAARTRPKPRSRPTCIWKARTSTAAGSIRRCWSSCMMDGVPPYRGAAHARLRRRRRQAAR